MEEHAAVNPIWYNQTWRKNPLFLKPPKIKTSKTICTWPGVESIHLDLRFKPWYLTYQQWTEIGETFHWGRNLTSPTTQTTGTKLFEIPQNQWFTNPLQCKMQTPHAVGVTPTGHPCAIGRNQVLQHVAGPILKFLGCRHIEDSCTSHPKMIHWNPYGTCYDICILVGGAITFNHLEKNQSSSMGRIIPYIDIYCGK